MSSEKFSVLAKKYHKNKNAKAKAALVEEFLPIIKNVAKKFYVRPGQEEDVVQIGLVGLLKAIDYYRPSQERAFLPYAISMAMGEIKHYFRDSAHEIRIPRKYVQLSGKINQYTQQYIQEHRGVSPTVAMIAKAIGETIAQVREVFEAMNIGQMVSTEQDLQSDGAVFTHTIDTAFLLDSILKKLSYREQKIVQLYFLHNKTQKEIASRFDLSQAQVFRILNQALVRCREVLDGQADIH